MERLLEECSELRGRAVLVQITNPAHSHGRDVEEVADEARSITRYINARFGRPGYNPIVLVDRPVSTFEKVAYYAATECVVVSARPHGSAVVLAERDRACCSGVDITADENTFKGDVKDPNAAPAIAMAACRKPIASVIAGFAVTAGFEIAFACDLLGGPRRQVRQHRPRASPPNLAERLREPQRLIDNGMTACQLALNQLITAYQVFDLWPQRAATSVQAAAFKAEHAQAADALQNVPTIGARRRADRGRQR
ncbi:uncharacterized protein LOC109707779 [Ananas comosus]|uniref:Uncharacterized protein LOC109707779 n=1 Tax=Ananas comosus TaxID=4615 RepID=A0A6P5EMP5_ANACO|nr:uncharacterized protein LOC109707779 [Ananas comosus]